MGAYRYRYFGRILNSEIALQLPPVSSDGACFFSVEVGGASVMSRLSGQSVLSWRDDTYHASIEVTRIADGSQLVTIHDKYRYLVTQHGRKIVIDPDGPSRMTDKCYVLINQLLPMAASLSGMLIFHGAAVLLPEGAVLMIGDSGAGKSTLSSYLASTGGQLIGDDCVMLERADKHWLAISNYPSLRLWPENAQRLLGAASDRGIPVSSYCNKKNFLHTQDSTVPVCETPVPVSRIFLLDNRDAVNSAEVEIGKIDSQAAFKTLLTSLFRLDPTNKGIFADEFKALADIAKQIPIQRLSYPKQYENLPAVHKAIEQNLV